MNIGLHDGILDPKHEDSMGSAIWLYIWCVAKQTKRSGLVLGGMPLTYAEISKRTRGIAERKLRRWLPVLRDKGYIGVEYLNFKMMRLTVLKSKKFDFNQTRLDFKASPEKGQRKHEPMPEKGQRVRPKTGGGPTKNGQSKQSVKERYIEATTTPAMPEGIAALVPLATWLEFVAMRKSIRKPLMPGDPERVLRNLLEFQAAGDEPVAVLEQSILSQWPGVFPLKGNKNGQQESFAEKRSRKSAEAIQNVLGRFEKEPSRIRGALPPADK